jgi:hypothetical protein
MEFKTYKGRIAVLGDAISSTNQTGSINTYSYIELEGGQILRRFRTVMGLDGQFVAAFKENEVVELHVNEVLTGVPDPGVALLAIRRGNGKLYATHIPPSEMPFILRVLPTVCFVAGLFTFWVGIGFLIWWAGWKLYKFKKTFAKGDEVRSYIKSLDGAIEI